MAGAEIRVEGLKEFRRELKAVEASFPKELRRINKRIADQVAERTRASLDSGPGSSKLVTPTVKALAQQARAQVKVGGGSTVGSLVAMGNIWGSNRFKQFPAPRKGGYHLYPAIAELRDEISSSYLSMLDDLTKRAFPS